jgi:hypothetical protein
MNTQTSATNAPNETQQGGYALKPSRSLGGFANTELTDWSPTGWQPGKASKQKLSADYIKDSISPVDFYRHELPSAKLKTHAWNDGGLCPFHDDNKA